MSVGLYDADFFTYHQTIFNLEIMKLATYFKKKKEITTMAPSFSPDHYSQFYYRKDFNDGILPKNLNQFSNIQYGGLAFSNNKYVPLAEEIEQCAPDTSIYDRHENIFTEDNGTNRLNFKSQQRGIHFRLSLDGQTIWKDFKKQIPKNSRARVCFLHDQNLANIEGAHETIKSIMEQVKLSEKTKISLCNKFPIITHDFKNFSSWLDFVNASLYFNIQYNGMLEDNEIVEIVNKINPSNSTNIYYNPFVSSYGADDFSEELLIKIFKQTLFLYRNQKQFLLTYSNSFQVPDEIKKMLNLFTAYGRSGATPPTSLFYFVKQLRKQPRYHRELITMPEAIDVFYYTQKNYPELFKLFYEAGGAEFKGGELQFC